MKPMRKVLRAFLKEGSSVIADFPIRWWRLTLECGHEVERTARSNCKRRGYARMHHPPPRDELLPAQKRARCEECPDQCKGISRNESA